MIEYTVKVYDYKTVWYLDGKLHRLDGPALEYIDGHKEWFIEGQRHRIDGPAIEYPSGLKQWFLNDVQYTEKQYNAKMNQVKELTLEEISQMLGYSVKVVK